MSSQTDLPAGRATPDRETTARRLLQSSAKLSYDPDVDIDWDAPLAPDKFYVSEQLISLYGTKMWDGLSLEQRIELSKQELVNTLSLGIWFETILMQLLLKLAYHHDPTSQHVFYAYTEVADECRHSTMFGRVIERVGERPYPQHPMWFRIGKLLPTILRGAPMWVATLMGEEVFDVLQRDTMRDERLQPLVQSVMRIHVTEEARHVRYAREDLVRCLRRGNRLEKEFTRIVAARAAQLLAASFVNPAQYRRAGLDPVEAKRQAMANPHHREAKRHGAERVVRFLNEHDLIGGPSKALWIRSGLLAG